MTLGKRQNRRERKPIGGCRGLQVEEMPPTDMGDERSRVTDLSGVTALFGVTELSGAMDLCILMVVVVTQLCHHSQKIATKRMTFTVYTLHFNTHMHTNLNWLHSTF